MENTIVKFLKQIIDILIPYDVIIIFKQNVKNKKYYQNVACHTSFERIFIEEYELGIFKTKNEVLTPYDVIQMIHENLFI